MAGDTTYIAEMFPSRVHFNHFYVRTLLVEVSFLDGTTRLENLRMEIHIDQVIGKLNMDNEAWVGKAFLKNGKWNFLTNKYYCVD